MKNAIIAAVVAALVSSGATYAGTKTIFQTRTTVVQSAIVSVPADSRGYAIADCPSEYVATGGGVTSSAIEGAGATVTDSAPAPLTGRLALGWYVSVQNPTDSPVSIQAYAVCAK